METPLPHPFIGRTRAVEQVENKHWKQTLSGTLISRHRNPLCIREHSRSLIYSAFYRVNMYRAGFIYSDFTPWRSIPINWEIQAIAGSSKATSMQSYISENKLVKYTIWNLTIQLKMTNSWLLCCYKRVIKSSAESIYCNNKHQVYIIKGI